jgi:hypothetical protein
MIKLLLNSIWHIFAFLFVVHIINTYLLTDPYQWKTLPGLCCQNSKVIPMYIHFIGGIIVIVVGTIQVMRIKFHKYTGWLYIAGCMLSAIGGLVFILFNGTVGGFYMTVPFTIYGILMIIYPLVTWYYIKQNMVTRHRNWAIRTFLLGCGSMLFRMLYISSCMLFTFCGKVTFHNFIDYFFDWLFFVIPMIIAEIYIYLYK